MVKKILFAALLLCGCTTVPKNEYLEGTALNIGLYIPYNGTLYGVQMFNYLSGKRIQTLTNELNVSSQHSLTNKSFGVYTISSDKTEVK